MNINKAHIALFIANLIYGINYSLAKDVMNGFIEPFGFIFIRAGVAMLLFWFVSFFFRKGKIQIERKDFLRLSICGFFGVALNQLMFFKGLDFTSPINAGIIMTMNPIFVIIIASFILKEKITFIKIIGIVLGILGALTLIIVKSEASFSFQSTIGDIFVLINAISYGIYLVLVKPLMQKYNTIDIIKWVFTFGFAFVFSFGFGEFSEISWSGFSTKIWLELAFVVVCTTFIAYFFNIYALRNLSPSVVSIYIYLQPVLATIFSILFYNGTIN